jgi:CubicO group peptidase (beta-lactamase class C family)
MTVTIRRWSSGLLSGLCLVVSAEACDRPPADPPVPPAPPATTIVTGELGRRLDDYLTRAARFGWSGAVLVAKNGQIVLQNGYGLADREAGRVVTPGTVFSIGSLTKQFTAAAILRLEERRRLATSDPLRRFFPAAPADKAGITIHQLLTHTAGFPDALGGDYDPISRDSLVRLAFATPLRFAPGTAYEYSNVGYSVLAAIIELVSKMPYETFLRRELFLPAGLAETGYTIGWSADRFAIGYDDTTRWGTSVERWRGSPPSWHVVGNGELQSTVGDLYRWVAALDSGRVLADSSRRKMFTPWVPEDPTGETRYGYGWVIASSEWGTDLVWHNGGNGVFYAEIRRLKDDKAVVVFLTNSEANYSMLRDLVHVAFGLPAPDIPAPATTGAPAGLAADTGRYRMPSGPEISVRLNRGQLEIATLDPEAAMAFVPLTPPGADTGRRYVIKDPAATTMLERLAAGDDAPLLAFLEPPPEARAPLQERWRSLLGGWTATDGAFRSVRMLGSRVTLREPSRRFEIYGVMRFERGAHIIRIIDREGEGPSFRSVGPIPPGPMPPSRVWLVPKADSGFVAYLPSFGTSIGVRFQPATGRARALTIDTPIRPIRAIAAERSTP